MNKVFSLCLLAGAALTLQACESKIAYDKTPYQNRTAGKGPMIYKSDQPVSPTVAETRTIEEETVTRIGPAAGPEDRGERVFHDAMRK